MLSQAVGYAATALGYVAAAGGSPILVKEIAEASGIPGSYLAKIINVLARKSLVVTQRGIGGGVVLARPAKEITLFDICVALDDSSVQPRCMLGTAECSDERACPAHEFWCGQRDQYLAFLKGTSIADIAAFETRRRWKTAAATNGNGHADHNGNSEHAAIDAQISRFMPGNDHRVYHTIDRK
ncbi:Rrf2 family transcriptional regulator [Leptolyngbya sp. 15MV]|nr:Rrf2 family transcriptional regulator [Leptolyngbya sp. 15MV]